MYGSCALLILITPAMAVASTTDSDLVAEPLAGPFASIDAYCEAVPARSLDEQTGYVCASEPKGSEDGEVLARACPDPSFVPLAGGVLNEARMIEVRGKGRPLCFLAWRTAAGWYVDEDSFRPTLWREDGVTNHSRHFDALVAARPSPAPTGRGVVGRVRERSVTVGYDRGGDGDSYLECTDQLLLYGVGPSGVLSKIRHDVGYHSHCDAIAEEDQKLPPSRWDEYRIDLLLPDGRLRLRLVGRHPPKGAPRVTDHVLRFR
jgi:hypothetical protein